MKNICAIIFCCVLLISCEKKGFIKYDVVDSTKQIDTSSNKIIEQVQIIEKNKPELKPQLDPIVIEAQRILEFSGNITKGYQQFSSDTTIAIDSLQKQNKKFEDVIKKQQGEIKDLKSQKDLWYDRCLAAIIIASGLGVAVSLVLFFMGKLPSLTLSLVGIAVLAGAIFLKVLQAYFLYVAGGFGLLIALVIGYVAFKQKKQSINKDKGISEIVKSVNEGIESGAIDQTKFTEIANKTQTPNLGKVLVDRVQGKINETNFNRVFGKRRPKGSNTGKGK
jgi:hypothetical protein